MEYNAEGIFISAKLCRLASFMIHWNITGSPVDKPTMGYFSNGQIFGSQVTSFQQSNFSCKIIIIYSTAPAWRDLAAFDNWCGSSVSLWSSRCSGWNHPHIVVAGRLIGKLWQTNFMTILILWSHDDDDDASTSWDQAGYHPCSNVTNLKHAHNLTQILRLNWC